MASDKIYLDFLLEQLEELEDIAYRPMMGEFLLYYREKIFGGIYDNRLMVKIVPAAEKILGDASREAPYPGAREMLVVENVENRALLTELITSMYEELPAVKPRRKK